MAVILDGKALSSKLKEDYKKEVARLKYEYMKEPTLAVILVGDNPASQVYVGHKEKMCDEIGIRSIVIKMDQMTSEEGLLEKIKELNLDEDIHGILVQLPLPKHIREDKIIEAINPSKDVDSFHPETAGRMMNATKGLRPCTPSGIIELLEHYEIEIEGKIAVVIGRSHIVGKPMSLLLLEKNATVIICHSKTKDLKHFVQAADILVVATGQKGMIQSKDVKQGGVIIDVGIHRDEHNRLKGDVDFSGGVDHLKAYTPVPGGVGPMTIMMLMKNTIQAYQSQVIK